jgi:hypothetical protein
MTIALRTGERDYELVVEEGWVRARRGAARDPRLRISGSPWQVMATLVAGADEDGVGAEVEGDRAALEELRAWVSLPEAHLEVAEAEIAAAT